MLCINHLTTGYKHTIIGENLSANLQIGTFTALLGTNGSGKSTLLRTIAGLLPPIKCLTNGKSETNTETFSPITWENHSLIDIPPRTLARIVSIVLTFRPEIDALTAREVVEMGRIPYLNTFGGLSEEDRCQVEKAMELTDTKSFAMRPVSQLSDGERQRIFIAKAFAQNTPLILLDEPTAFLDFPTKVKIMRLLAFLAQKEHKTILLSTHDVEIALAFCTHLWLLKPSKIVSGTTTELVKDGSLSKFFKTEGISFNSQTLKFNFQKNS